MGFDNECILNIQSLAGEYFCPVCRLLVYPDEAMQSQCTHLYCKPCLTYVVSTTRACPYDGYLVTTADSKPLIESNKALAETIGKVAVHCLYNRSGCTWQGPLTDCITHCSGCAFGNSPVVCNRCGIQIVHRQVLEHAQNCPGVQQQVQQVGTTEPSSNVTASAVDQNQPATQSAPEASQVQASQPTAILSASGQVSNQPIISSSQGQGLTQSTILTQEQWYQQQQQHYQQYYQQYPGYDPYQQQYQQYYPYQQPASIQPQPSNLSSQHQTQGLMQPQPQTQTQPLPQVQVQPQSQLPPPPPLYMVHGQSQSTTESQTSTTTGPQTHVQFNTQQQPYPSGNTHSHIPPQIHPSPISHSHPQPLSYPQAQPHPQQSAQTLHYQQSHPHAQNQQGQIQQQAYPQLQPQQHSVSQSQSQSQHHTLPQTQIAQHNQPINTNMQPQMQNPPAHAVTGLHSYPPPQPHQQLLTGVPQPTIQTPSQTGSLLQPHPNQMQDHLPQQPPTMRPMQSHVTYPNQQHPPSLLSPAQAQNTSHVPQLPTSVHAQQPGHTGNHRPIMNAVHQLTSQQQIQQKQHFVQQGQHLPQQVPIASHLGSHGLPHALAQHNIGYLHPNTTMPNKMQQNQSQNLAGWPMGVSHGVQSLSHSQSMTVSHLRQIQTRENIPSTYQSHDYRNNTRVQQGDQPSLESARRTMIDGHAGHKDTADKEGKLTSQKATVVNDSDVKPVIRGDVNELKSVKSEAEADPVDQKYCLNGKVKSGNEALGSELLDGGSWEPLTKETEGKTDAKESAFDHSVVDISGNGVTKDPKEIDGVESKQMKHSDSENKEIGESLLKNPSSQDANYVEQIGMPMTTPAGGHESLKATPNPSASFDDSPFSEKRKLAHHDAFHEKGQQHTSGFVQTSHPVPVVDPGRHQLQSNNSGPSTPPMLPPPPSGQLYHQASANPPMQYRLQAPGYPEHAALTSEHYLQSAIPELGSAASFGMRPGNYTSPHQGKAQFLGLDQYPPSHWASNMPLVSSSGGHDLLDHVGARAPLRISEAQLGIPHPHPIHHIGNEIIPNLMPEGGRSGSAGPPQLAAMHMRMNVAPGFESSLIPDEKFKLMGERMKSFSLDSARGEFQDDLKQLNRLSHLDTEPFQNYGSHPLRNLDMGIHGPNHVSDLQLDSLGVGGGGASRFFAPHNLGRGFNPSYERREITRRTDLAHGHRDFFGSDLGYPRRHLDGLGPRSTFQDYHRNNSRGYGGLPGISSFDEIDGRELRRFGDSFTNKLSESRYPFSSRSEFDGHGNFSMGEHLRSGDFIGRDRHYDHLRLGERSGLGAHPGHGLMGELDRFGRVEAFGSGNRQSHLRPGEPGFRSSFSLQGFPDDSRIYSGDTDASGGWRKRRSLSMGWCRICKVDCATVEGLDLHSQTREHQKMAMDMVQCIKQSAKKQKLSASENPLSEDADPSTNGDLEGQRKSIK